MIPPSPSMLQPPSNHTQGVRRLNRLPLALLCAGVGASVFVLGYTIVKHYGSTQTVAQEDAKNQKIQGSTKPAFLAAPVKNETRAADPPQTAPPKTQPPPAATAADPRIVVGNTTLEDKARAQAWEAYYQAVAQRVAAHNALEQDAHSGNMDVMKGGAAGTEQSPFSGSGVDGPPANPNSAGSGLPYSTGGVNPDGQTGKQAFLRTPGDPYGQNEDMPGSVHGPKPMTVMEGTPLPCRLVEGATSDMPGQLIAEIGTNINDSMTGDHLLIPQGTRLITSYDIAISAGQNRLGTIGQRLIFPDTSSRQLGSVPIADQSGLAGLKDLLDTHFWEKFGSALTIALIGAGAQLSQPQQS